jgi:hypothetical protein
MTSENRQRAIDEILDAARTPCPKIVKRSTMTDPSDGRHYSTMFPPHNNTSDWPRKEYYVFQANDGTTYGKQYQTEQEARDQHAKNEQRIAEDFAKQLREMTGERVEAQYEYWTKKSAAELVA